MANKQFRIGRDASNAVDYSQNSIADNLGNYQIALAQNTAHTVTLLAPAPTNKIKLKGSKPFWYGLTTPLTPLIVGTPTTNDQELVIGTEIFNSENWSMRRRA